MYVADMLGIAPHELAEWTAQDAHVAVRYRSGKALGEWATWHPWDEKPRG